MISRLCIHLRKVGSETTILFGDSRTVKKTWGTGATDLETEANAHSLAFLDTAFSTAGETASDQTNSFGSASTSRAPGYGIQDVVDALKNNRLSGSTIYCGGENGSNASNLEAASDWKGKSRAKGDPDPGISEELDIEAGHASCGEEDGSSGAGNPDSGFPVADVPGLGDHGDSDLEVSCGGCDTNAGPRINNVQRSTSRNTLELMHLVRGIRQFIYPGESV